MMGNLQAMGDITNKPEKFRGQKNFFTDLRKSQA